MNASASRFRIGLLVTLSFSCLWAQDGVPGLYGTVRDSSRMPISKAIVTAKNLDTGETTEVRTSSDGLYSLVPIDPGEYEVSAAAAGFATSTTKVNVDQAVERKLDFTLLVAPAATGQISLEDLGFTAQQTQGSAAQQALLDKRSHMLQMHQRLGLLAAIPMVAALISSGGAKQRRGSTTGRDVHMALGLATAGLYYTSAYYAIRAPKVAGTQARGPIRLHRTLAWIHGIGMIATPILGMLAYQQIDRGERVHGIASAHAAVAWTTALAYGTSIAAVSLKF